jgi:hypothetical protein
VTFRQFIEAIVCGLILSTPFIIEIIKELLK